MSRFLRRGGLLLVMALAGGCALVETGPRRPTPVEDAGLPPTLDELGVLAYAATLLDADERQLDGERRRLQRRYREAPDGDAALRLALLLGLPDSRFRDAPRARQLLTEWAPSFEPDPSRAAMARLLALFLERQDTQERVLNRTRRSLAAERDRRVRLQQQLEALKSIEERINRSEPPDTVVPAKPPAGDDG